MDEIIKQMKQLYDLMADKELAQAISKMYWNIFTELKNAGFTEDQAFQIVSKFELKK